MTRASNSVVAEPNPASTTVDATSTPAPATPAHDAETPGAIFTPAAPGSQFDLLDVTAIKGPGVEPDERPAPRRARGRPSKGAPRRINPDADAPAQLAPGITANEAKLKRYRDTAEMSVHMVTGALEQFGGEHWKPSEGEDKMLVDATHRYFVAKDIPDIPPGWMLFLVVMAYATPRLNHEKTKAQIGAIKAKILGPRRMPAAPAN